MFFGHAQNRTTITSPLPPLHIWQKRLVAIRHFRLFGCRSTAELGTHQGPTFCKSKLEMLGTGTRQSHA